MAAWLLLVFVLLPLAELLLLIWIGQQIGFWPTFALVIGTGVVGGMVARWQGPVAWREIVTTWQSGRVPAAELVAGALFLMAAVALITPGVITDILGALLMVPAIRRFVGQRVVNVFRRRVRLAPESHVVRIRPVE